MENNSRHVFALDGVTGMLIATVLLLSILVVLTILGVKAQQDVAQEPYSLHNVENVSKFSNVEIANETMKLKK